MNETNDTSEFAIRRQLLQMEMLYEIGLAISESLDPTYVAQEVLNRALVMVDARGALLLVKEREEAPLEIAGQVGLEDPHREATELLQSVQADEVWLQGKLVQKERDATTWRHLCIVPLESRQEVAGLLLIADKEHRDGTVGPFDESDETVLRSFAYQAGAALHNARLHRHLEEAYQQLQAAQKKLAQMEQLRALGNLAADVAHTMSHILGIIIGRADMYLNLHRDPDKAMQAILETAESGQSIIERIQQFTRLGVGKKRSPLLVHELLRRALDDIQTFWQQRHGAEGPDIKWQTRLSPLPETYANPTAMKELIHNLLINALEAMPAGGNLTVECRQEDDQIVLEITDTGTGMSEEVQNRIFEPFFTTKEETGTGLGIVYRIVNDHDGEIEVQSAPGQGSCFALHFPIRSEAPPDPEEEDEDGTADFDS